MTETALLADFDVARLNLTKLRAQGVNIVLDDFGAGYSSIGYLLEMNFEAIKLDGSLITSASQDKSCIPLLRGFYPCARRFRSHVLQSILKMNGS